MPDLLQSLANQDIGHLRIIAELWGLELISQNAEAARGELSASFLDVKMLTEIFESLPPKSREAIAALVASNGRIPWATFTRQFGDIREIGAAKRDRERPHLKPISTAETLFYRGLVARAFFETDKSSQEFAYIPDELMPLIKVIGVKLASPLQNNEPLGRPASPTEKGKEILADDSILDEATTLLAALRMGKPNWQYDSRLSVLLNSAKLLKNNTIQTEPVKTFLESSRADALKRLQGAWVESDTINELKLMPSIICEGEWTNNPQETRDFLLNHMDAIPNGKWWSLSSFISDIKQKHSDFQRPSGDYDSWFIKRASDGQYLRGFESWNEVDGALIRFFVTDILHWLGRVDLSFAEGAMEATAFRVSSFEGRKEEKGKIGVSSNGKISIPRNAPRVVRYQISRFCEWDEPKKDEFKYHITAQSLKQAVEQGLKTEQLLSLLVKHTEGKVPPPLVKALKRWETNGTEARAETQTILRVSKPEALEEMRKSRAGKFLGEVLSPTAVIVKSGAIQKVMEALMELGVLAENLTEEK